MTLDRVGRAPFGENFVVSFGEACMRRKYPQVYPSDVQSFRSYFTGNKRLLLYRNQSVNAL